MAFRMSRLRLVVAEVGGGRRSIGNSTSPKMKEAAAADGEHSGHSNAGMWAPIQLLGGFITVAVLLGCHTAYQQLVRSPSVHVNKQKRESMNEVEDPDDTVKDADKFINRSVLRKVGHIQDNKATLNDPSRPDPFTRPRTVESLKSAGVEPSKR